MSMGIWKNHVVLCSTEVKVNILTFKTKMEEVLPASQKPNHLHVLLNREYSKYFSWISDSIQANSSV